MAYLAHVEFAAGRFDEAATLARQSAQLSAYDDYAGQIEWRLVAAKVASVGGAGDDALRLSAEAVAIAKETESLVQTARAVEDLAHVQRSLGFTDDADRSVADVVEIHRRKGNRLALARFTEGA